MFVLLCHREILSHHFWRFCMVFPVRYQWVARHWSEKLCCVQQTIQKKKCFHLNTKTLDSTQMFLVWREAQFSSGNFWQMSNSALLPCNYIYTVKLETSVPFPLEILRIKILYSLKLWDQNMFYSNGDCSVLNIMDGLKRHRLTIW